jgi:hypothetical protein
MPYTDEQIASFPPWLQKIARMKPEAREAAGYTDEDIDQAAKAHHLDRDYTQAKQKLSTYEKHLGDADPEEVGKLRQWWDQHGQEVNEVWAHRDRLRQPERPVEPARPANGTRRSWRETEAADLYETARLRETFEDLREDTISAAAERVRKDWYEKEEMPRLDSVAAGFFSRALDIMDAVRDPALADIGPYDLIKEAAAQGLKPSADGRMNFRKLGVDMLERRKAERQAAADEGYKRGLEEGKKAAPPSDGPSGPVGAPQPTWRPAPGDQRPKTREELRGRVMTDLEKKYGTTLPA